MTENHRTITVFEHDSLWTDRGQIRLTQKQLETLQRFYGEKGVPYFSLIHHGIKFGQYVGVIQIGNTIIEILPKVDKIIEDRPWRDFLINMLHTVGLFELHAPSSSSLLLTTNSILDLYFKLYILELEYLLRRGLVKKYRKIEGNTTVLKGNIHFAKHLNKNLVHKERFYVRHQTFDSEHQVNMILYKALKLLRRINTNVHLNSRLSSLMLNFPEMKDVKVSDSMFDRIQIDRKTEPYRNALEIARLILLNFHPDLSQGPNNVLALMFDMNLLWEKFVYRSLRKYMPKETQILSQATRNFWKPTIGYRSVIKPDIVMNEDKENCVVLDTKWKNLGGSNPSSNDLRQMFVYMKYYKARKVALVYPGNETLITSGTYYNENSRLPDDKECCLISFEVNKDIRTWQKQMSARICSWMNSN